MNLACNLMLTFSFVHPSFTFSSAPKRTKPHEPYGPAPRDKEGIKKELVAHGWLPWGAAKHTMMVVRFGTDPDLNDWTGRELLKLNQARRRGFLQQVPMQEWSAEERKALRVAVGNMKVGEDFWERLAEGVEGRSARECYQEMYEESPSSSSSFRCILSAHFSWNSVSS